MDRPVLLLAGLLVDLLFFVIRRIGDKMGGWSALEDDEDDILLATVKAKEARRRRKRDGEKAPETRPRKTIILLALVILALSYSMDGSLLILASTFGSENIAAAAKDEVLWAVMGSMVAYTWYSMKVYAATPDAAGKSMLVKVVSGLSLTFHVAMLTSMSLSAFFGKSPHCDE